jgi:hypothetical protein
MPKIVNNVNKIQQDILDKCYVKNCDYYKLNYHEYILSVDYASDFIFNSLDLSFNSINTFINNKILIDNRCLPKYFNNDNTVNIKIVDDILNSLIDKGTKTMYKKLLYNLIVKQEEKQIIFNDYNECLLTTWIKDLFSNISDSKIIYFYSSEYYENISEINKFIKKYRPRFVIIDTLKFPIEKQINDLLNKGIKNFIIKNNDKNNTMYNLDNFRTYLKNNNEISKKCSENNFQHDDEIFNHSKLYLTNFLIWCCVK